MTGQRADSSRRTLIIGYGNPLRGDDGVGPAVAGRLLADLPSAAEVLIVHQITIDLAEQITRFERVILIDAMADLPPGEVQVYAITPEDGTLDMSHYVTPGALLLAAEVLYGCSPAAVMVGIGASHFDGEGLTVSVSGAVDEAARIIHEMLFG